MSKLVKPIRMSKLPQTISISLILLLTLTFAGALISNATAGSNDYANVDVISALSSDRTYWRVQVTVTAKTLGPLPSSVTIQLSSYFQGQQFNLQQSPVSSDGVTATNAFNVPFQLDGNYKFVAVASDPTGLLLGSDSSRAIAKSDGVSADIQIIAKLSPDRIWIVKVIVKQGKLAPPLPPFVTIQMTSSYTSDLLTPFTAFNTQQVTVGSNGQVASAVFSVASLGNGHYLFSVTATDPSTGLILGFGQIDPDDREGTAQSPPAGDDKSISEASKYI